jgi:RimJ/RimL family protein N-acetyltransferase
MQKLGMRHEGTLRGHVVKWDRREDIECYGILREEFAS